MSATTNNPAVIGPYQCGRGRALLLIAGPCVIESEELTLGIARRLKEIVVGLPVQLVFKASFDKANRTSGAAFRGAGLEAGLAVLSKVRESTGLPVTTDIHESWQAEPVSKVCDLLQIPAFLARQTDLLVAAAKTGKAVNVKKGQFMAPWDMRSVLAKLNAAGCQNVLLCERGTFFGYGRLVNDMRSLPQMQALGAPVIFDATHSVQEPGGLGTATGGNREMVEPVARAATAIGVDGLFFEVHPDPDNAPSDGPNMLRLDAFPAVLQRILAIRQTVESFFLMAAKNSRLNAPFALQLAVLTLAAGCTEQAALTPTTPARATMTPAAADLTLALESLRKLAEGNDNQPGQRTIFYLNQWISSDPAAAAEWKPDRMLDSVPRALRNTPGLERLNKLQFSLDDVDYLRQFQWLDDISYLQQNLWLHDIAQRVRREPSPARLRAWMKEIETSVGLPEAEQLATAELMLDWVARNIQLDELPPIPRDPLATAGSTETVLPSLRGEVGPGYSQLPLEILLYGHGDAHERARIFILLCRQVGIEACMLGFQEEQSTARRGWLPAVLAGGKLYLFDTGLGLPIPGPEGKGIATLDQVLKDVKLLRQLDIPGVAAYPVIEKDLKQGVLAMIDAEPAALSRRMQLLQAAMPQAMKLALATQPSQFEPKLRKANVSGVSLWPAAFDAVLYRIGIHQRAASDVELAKKLHLQGILFLPARPLIKARNLHLQGRYENEDQKPGARSLYLQCRQPDRQIDALVNNEFYRKSIGLEQNLPQDPAQRQAQLDFITSIARGEKYDATFWLALTHSDAGKPGAAIEWLGKPVVETSPPGPWIPGARYNLARCYEQLGQIDLARQWLESDKESPQRHGNLLRAKMLAQPVASK